MYIFDHVAIGCENLADGVAWTEEQLGVKLVQGGQHVHFGTHNMLLGMGDIYLEVIAKNPDAKPTGRATWFDLDNFEGPPRLANWICRSENPSAASDITGPPVQLSRDKLTWELTVPEDGSLPMQGGYPSLLKWGEGITPPSGNLPDSGCHLTQWIVSHPKAEWLRQHVPIDDARVNFVNGAPGFSATITTPDGMRHL
ncbi:VOC family protein [Yoonia sp. 208BN28-4]|uniref:VOC family protein n=1 Tax=Yoonia sp. 208BN28-4 TaxID=3126505 RepID=UPI0030AE30C8